MINFELFIKQKTEFKFVLFFMVQTLQSSGGPKFVLSGDPLYIQKSWKQISVLNSSKNECKTKQKLTWGPIDNFLGFCFLLFGRIEGLKHTSLPGPLTSRTH